MSRRPRELISIACLRWRRERRANARRRPRVQDVCGSSQRAARPTTPQRSPPSAAASGRRIDHELHAAIARQPRVDVVQIEPIDLAVDLERHAVPRPRRRRPRSMSKRYGSRFRSSRPVGWPRTSTHGHSSARSSRSVICARSWLNAECTEATTMSSCREAVVGEIHRAVGPDVALDAGEQRDAVEPSVRARGSRARARARAARRGRWPSRAPGCDR